MIAEKKIIIPNIECMDEDKYKELIDLLDSCPVNYELWEKEVE